jgi:ferric-dicitrate binding protein FerR (iron transport regulator)
MNVTKEVITDLFPLYVANECSKDSRALIEDYLRNNPNQAEELKRIMNMSVPSGGARLAGSEEVRTLREARRRVRRQSWVMGLAIFFSLLPFSFLVTSERIYWLFRESPGTAVVYAAIGGGCWGLYFVMRSRSKILSAR